MATLAFETFLGGVDARGFLFGVTDLASGVPPGSFLVDLGGGGVGGRFLAISVSSVVSFGLPGVSWRLFLTEIEGDTCGSRVRTRALVGSGGETTDLPSGLVGSEGVAGRAFDSAFGFGFGFGFGFEFSMGSAMGG